MTFNIGDIVRLKSGGPKMTILGIDGDESTYACKWFDRNGRLNRDSFQASTIEAFISRPAPAPIPRPDFNDG